MFWAVENQFLSIVSHNYAIKSQITLFSRPRSQKLRETEPIVAEFFGQLFKKVSRWKHVIPGRNQTRLYRKGVVQCFRGEYDGSGELEIQMERSA